MRKLSSGKGHDLGAPTQGSRACWWWCRCSDPSSSTSEPAPPAIRLHRWSLLCHIWGGLAPDQTGQPTPTPINLTIVGIIRKAFLFHFLYALHLEALRNVLLLTTFSSGLELIELCITVIICLLICFCKPASSSSRPYLCVARSRQELCTETGYHNKLHSINEANTY